MKLDHAIERQKAIVESGEYEGNPWDRPAVELGIEALKRLQEIRRHPGVDAAIPLPGETEE